MEPSSSTDQAAGSSPVSTMAGKRTGGGFGKSRIHGVSLLPLTEFPSIPRFPGRCRRLRGRIPPPGNRRCGRTSALPVTSRLDAWLRLVKPNRRTSSSYSRRGIVQHRAEHAGVEHAPDIVPPGSLAFLLGTADGFGQKLPRAQATSNWSSGWSKLWAMSVSSPIATVALAPRFWAFSLSHFADQEAVERGQEEGAEFAFFPFRRAG